MAQIKHNQQLQDEYKKQEKTTKQLEKLIFNLRNLAVKAGYIDAELGSELHSITDKFWAVSHKSILS